MKKLNITFPLLFLAFIISLSGCYKLQKDYKYVKYELDPRINMTAKAFLQSRGNVPGADTIFKWMQLGIEYAGIDWAEYEKPKRTYIFLANSAIRVYNTTTKMTTGGFFFDHPIVVKDANGAPIKSKVPFPGTTTFPDSIRPAVNWNEYSKETVKNYLLYLIIEGEFGFNNLGVPNTPVQTLLPAGTTVPYTDSRLGWVVTKSAPNPDASSATSITTSYPSGGSGFDPEGKMNLKIANTDQSPINVNDRTNDRSAGYIGTNGQIHVFGATVHPFRYSYL